MVTVQELQQIRIFQDLSPEHLRRILPSLTERTYPAGATIIHRGDPGYSMFMILRGSVDVCLTNDEGIEYSINTQGEGENFGEMALMTGEPRSAKVKALTEVRLAELSQEQFFALIDAFPELSDSLLQQLAQRRAKTMVRQQFADLERAEIIAQLFAQAPPDIDRLVGSSKWTVETNASIARLAASGSQLLILGERGTGKDLAARLVHFQSRATARPLFHLDCANPPPIRRESQAGRSGAPDTLSLELAQESALFGHVAGAGSYAKGIRRGYLELADGGSVVLENIDSLSRRLQRLLIDYLRSGTLIRTGDSHPIASTARLISTCARTLAELQGAGTLDPEFLTLAAAETLQLKPLRERKKDLPELAHYLVGEYNKKFAKEVTGFSKEALNSLVDHDWPLNVDELHQVLERAVLISEGGTITERQVFLNVPTFSATGTFNILRIPSLRRLVSHPLVPKALQGVTVPVILALTLLTCLGPPERNPANLVVWGVWWPFLIFSILVSARSWCGYCPLPVISDGLNFFRRRSLKVPEPLARYGVWVGMAGFALILLAEHVTHMFSAARATSALLACIIAGTALTNFLFGKRSWCKHVCPLGRMVASSSALSLVELGSNGNVCSSQCQTHDCIKDHNCPMGIHPAAAGVSKECVLCLSCVKKCRHLAVRIDARFPWHELETRKKWNLSDALFAVSLVSLVLAVKLPSWEPLARIIAGSSGRHATLADLAASLATGSAFLLAAYFASGSRGSRRLNFSILGPSYLFLAFAGFFNIYFHELVYLGPDLLPWAFQWAGLEGLVPREWITPNLGTLKILVPLFTLAGALASFLMLGRLGDRYAITRAVRRTHQGVQLLATLVFLVVL